MNLRLDFKIAIIAVLALAHFGMLTEAVSSAPNKVQEEPSQRILTVAQESLGKKMWSGYGLPSGKLGCSAALGNVLKKAGFSYRGSAAVVVLRQQLLNGPMMVREIPVKQAVEYGVDPEKMKQVAKPGDLIFGYKDRPDKPNLGVDAHCGIVADSGRVYANDWNDGIWKCVVTDRFFAWYPHIYVMRIVGMKNTTK